MVHTLGANSVHLRRLLLLRLARAVTALDTFMFIADREVASSSISLCIRLIDRVVGLEE